MAAESGREHRPAPDAERAGAWKELGAWLAVLCAVLAVWHARVTLTHAIPNWNRTNPEGLLKSDPALLYWFTERIAAEHGLPEDFAHTRAVQWPATVDARVEFPQAQMWLAARTWNALGGGMPLHEWCVLLFGFLAAATGFGVYGLARELTGSRVLGLVALAAWCLVLASWRTTSFVLLGEDLSFPFLVAHFWLLARAARVRTPAAFLWAGGALLVAMFSWHAAGFFVAMEAAAFLAWTLRSGANPMSVRHAWLTLLPLALGCLLEPMLRGKLQLFSLPMQIAAVLGALAWIAARRARRGQAALGLGARCGLALALLAGAAGVGLLASRVLGGGLGDYSHVFGLIAAKLRHLGQFPDDPGELSFEVRILWQGPFDTIPLRILLLNLNSALLGFVLLVALAAPSWWRGEGRASEALLAAFAAVTLLATWLILRTVILSAVLLPVAGVVAAARWRARRPLLVSALAAAVLLLPPLPSFLDFLAHFAERNAWYNPDHVRELRQLVGSVEKQVPAGEPIASDEVTSPALLAHTGHPILVQPKYESAAARVALEEYRDVATRGTPEELARYLRERDVRYLVYDWRTLWSSRYQVGIPYSVNGMQPATALAQVVSDPKRLAGFEFLWKSAGGRYALYRLAADH